jgi:hypothetical protein
MELVPIRGQLLKIMRVYYQYECESARWNRVSGINSISDGLIPSISNLKMMARTMRWRVSNGSEGGGGEMAGDGATIQMMMTMTTTMR